MSLLDSTNWDEVQLARPILDRQAVRVTLVSVKEEVSERDSNRTDLIVVHSLAQEAKDTNGNVVHPGFQFTERFGQVAGASGGAATANRINAELIKKLMVAGLKVPLETKDVGRLLTEAGGWAALNGREVVATVAARVDKNDASRVFQSVKGYASVAGDAPAADSNVPY